MSGSPRPTRTLASAVPPENNPWQIVPYESPEAVVRSHFEHSVVPYVQQRFVPTHVTVALAFIAAHAGSDYRRHVQRQRLRDLYALLSGVSSISFYRRSIALMSLISIGLTNYTVYVRLNNHEPQALDDLTADYTSDYYWETPSDRRWWLSGDDAPAAIATTQLSPVQQALAASMFTYRPPRALYPNTYQHNAVNERRLEGVDTPADFSCPITMAVMDDPVCAPGLPPVERDAIEHELWLSGKNPFTRQALSVDDLKPCHELRERIGMFCEDKHSPAP